LGIRELWHHVKLRRCGRVELHKETLLQRLFSAFPGGLPGIALLLLRVVLATVLLVQGGYYLSEPISSTATWFVGMLGIALGALLFIGLLTPLTGALVALGAIGIKFSWIPACSRSLFASYVPAVFAVTILLTIIVLGPGAFSIDARIFGRREIIIPPSCSSRR
jgi:uncharacterized membrane protein YphA (DoxX/SURF4 family)